MFDIGWSELLLIGVVALIVIGPEDLPRMFRALGRMTAKARAMAREFSSAMEDAARESGVKEAADELRGIKSMTSKKALGLDALDRAAEKFEKWDPKLPAPRKGAQPDPAADAPAGQPAKAVSAAAPEAASLDAGTAAARPDARQPADDSDAEGEASGAPRRQLKAVRRSDLQA